MLFFFFTKVVKDSIYTQLGCSYLAANTNEDYSIHWAPINKDFQFSQRINNPTGLKFTSHNTLPFSTSSMRTWRRHCFSPWRHRCRPPRAPTAEEPVTCLPRSWRGASCLPSRTSPRGAQRRVTETATRLRSPQNHLLPIRGGTRGAGEAFLKPRWRWDAQSGCKVSLSPRWKMH